MLQNLIAVSNAIKIGHNASRCSHDMCDRAWLMECYIIFSMICWCTQMILWPRILVPNAPIELFFVVSLLLLLSAGASPPEIAVPLEELPEEAKATGILEIVVHVPPLVVRAGRARRVRPSQILLLPMATDRQQTSLARDNWRRESWMEIWNVYQWRISCRESEMALRVGLRHSGGLPRSRELWNAPGTAASFRKFMPGLQVPSFSHCEVKPFKLVMEIPRQPWTWLPPPVLMAWLLWGIFSFPTVLNFWNRLRREIAKS